MSKGFCKYRDDPRQWRFECPYGCTSKVTVCHKWANPKKKCKYARYAFCAFGVHHKPSGAFAQPSEEPTPKRQRTQEESVAEHVIALINKDPILVGSDKAGKNSYLRRMLNAMHPDKVNGTPLESTFQAITQEILMIKEKLDDNPYVSSASTSTSNSDHASCPD